ncbi:peptidoglycan-associated lipoprotein [Leptothrix cholodnii SP-6]|uniref:Peptidoglycan-associated lipoprotein n=1 Tax=Leptothrix cholodnii (strain ATCC 51168 / LMG 8142 / SP-6) TaxID=395495 RepID=B1Y6Q7_LEPCP|nr:peptidoglycan-associated lipoprotein Pal [Leptothrix cholodnii]ACB36085.1 peptidoglycan-associated lipoprotein [Leptothrix cholodnii SP-6]
MIRLTSAALVALTLAACSSTPPAPAPAPAPAPVAAAPAPAPAPAPTPAAAAPAPAPQVAAAALAPHLDPNHAISKQRSVFFDFDEFVIRTQDRPVVELHGKYLASTPALKVVIEGNADERGSREYNLALGNKRAQAVVQSFKLLGAADGQMEAISYGEERPMDAGHDEAAWAKNRRADVRYK